MKTLMNVLMLPIIIVGLCGITDAENIVTECGLKRITKKHGQQFSKL